MSNDLNKYIEINLTKEAYLETYLKKLTNDENTINKYFKELSRDNSSFSETYFVTNVGLGDETVLLFRPDLSNRPMISNNVKNTDKTVIGFKVILEENGRSEDGSYPLKIKKFVSLPNSIKREGEIEVSISIFNRNNIPQNNSNYKNIINKNFLETLPLISQITNENLKFWTNFLEWKKHVLISQSKYFKFDSFQVVENKLIFDVTEKDIPEELNNNTLYIFPEDVIKEIHLDENIKLKYLKEDLLKYRNWISSKNITYNDGSLECKLIKQDKATFDKGYAVFLESGEDSNIRNQSNALEKFTEQGSFAPFLSSYLFDIRKARIPLPNNESIEWHEGKDKLTYDQKNAVRVMLKCEDIALIQGPPGTGKTTVIAEAIYQFAKAGKKVLVTSESNDAVDNALDRLANEAVIIPMRLKSTGKIDDANRKLDEAERECREAKNDNEKRKAESKVENAKNKINSNSHRLSQKTACSEYFKTLSLPSKHIFNENEIEIKKAKHLNKYINQFEPLFQQLDNENLAEEKNEEKKKKSLKLLTQYEKENKETKESEKQHDALKKLVELFDEKKSQEIEELSQSDLSLFYLHVIEKLGDNYKIIFDNKWTNDRAHGPRVLTSWLENGLLRWFKRLESIPRIKTEHADLEETVGEVIIDEETKIKIERWNKAKKESEEQDDLDGLRAAQKELGKLKEKRGLEREFYQDFFDKDELVELCGESSSVSAAKKTLKAYIEKTEEIGFILSSNLDKVKIEFKSRLAKSVNRDFDNTKLNEAKNNIVDINRDLERNKENIKRLEGNIKSIISNMKNDEDMHSLLKDNNNSENILIILKIALERIELASTQHNKMIIQPLLEDWIENTETLEPTKEEENTYNNNINVVGRTCNAGDKLLQDINLENFDVVIIDEISKATPPEYLMSMMKANKAILVGDHRQLPPMFKYQKEDSCFEDVLHEEEDKEIFTHERYEYYKNMVTASLFKEHFYKAPEEIKCGLTKQFRMHTDIMDLINCFYDNTLEFGIGETKEDHNLQKCHNMNIGNLLSHDNHVIWVDTTKNLDGKENFQNQDGTSKSNPFEAFLTIEALVKIDNKLYENDERAKDGKKFNIGVISFYSGQIRLLTKMIQSLNLKYFDKDDKENFMISTVDSFQGRDRDIILVDLISTKNKVGKESFVSAFERINVAFSRAKRLLIIFGSKEKFDNYDVNVPKLEDDESDNFIKVYSKITNMINVKGGGRTPIDVGASNEKWDTFKKKYIK